MPHCLPPSLHLPQSLLGISIHETQTKWCLPCEVKPARSIRHWPDLAGLLDSLGPLVELGELDLGIRTFLTNTEADDDSEEEERERGHDVTVTR